MAASHGFEAYAILQAQEPLPPYELDPHFSMILLFTSASAI